MLESPHPERAEQTPEKRAGRSAGPALKTWPRRRLDTAPRRPPSDPIPRRICQPHELLRAQLTHPEPPDFGGDVPSCPPELRRTRPCHPVKPGRCGIDHSASILPFTREIYLR